MRRSQLIAMVVICAVGATAAGAESIGARPAITLTRAMPNPVRVGQVVTIGGRVRHVASAARAVLESKRAPQARWVVVARTRQRRGGLFTLRWRIPAPAGWMLWRVAVVSNARVLSATPSQQALVGQAPVYCKPPPPIMQNIPAGDGWIVGGDYIEGGPAPGLYECESQAYTVVARDQAGAVVASQQVAGGHSYVLVVPAGHYSLRASTCGFGSATVTSGTRTRADMVCPVP
jgi:hypothetical protein